MQIVGALMAHGATGYNVIFLEANKIVMLVSEFCDLLEEGNWLDKKLWF